LFFPLQFRSGCAVSIRTEFLDFIFVWLFSVIVQFSTQFIPLSTFIPGLGVVIQLLLYSFIQYMRLIKMLRSHLQVPILQGATVYVCLLLFYSEIGLAQMPAKLCDGLWLEVF